MKMYRKKPVVIEAAQLTPQNIADIYNWMLQSDRIVSIRTDNTISIGTLEGEMIANQGDWIIKGVKGEFYPCKPDIFEMTYEEVG